MEDFVIVIVKKFSYAQNYYNWNDMEVLCFLVFGFWFLVFSPLHMYNSNTDSLIIVGAHLTKK